LARVARTHEVSNHLNVQDTLFLGLTARQVASFIAFPSPPVLSDETVSVRTISATHEVINSRSSDPCLVTAPFCAPMGACDLDRTGMPVTRRASEMERRLGGRNPNAVRRVVPEPGHGRYTVHAATQASQA